MHFIPISIRDYKQNDEIVWNNTKHFNYHQIYMIILDNTNG